MKTKTSDSGVAKNKKALVDVAAPASDTVAPSREKMAKNGKGGVVPLTHLHGIDSEKSPNRAPETIHASSSSIMSTAVVPQKPVAPKKNPKLAENWKTKPAEELTDEEVLAMPESEYMNEKQLAFFRHKLLRLRQEILHSADETTEHLREETVVVPDPADRATIEEEHALELRTRDRERKLLKKIEQSLARIDSGDYGYCAETGEPIGVGRLIARPTATLSLEAQQRRELKQKLFGD